MPRKIEIATKLCAQLIRYLLSKNASNMSIKIDNCESQLSIVIESRALLNNHDIDSLKSYLKTESHEEMGYYYLPLVGEYGSDEDIALIAMLVNKVEIDYDKTSSILRMSFLIGRNK
ncbi:MULTISPECIES: hypothetical protein [Pseudothermotoga]|jgi:hypothetical protein|uniref:Uncharacterized protein n=1 Tax=Pseudothermotoga lettingae (strain ATCC BAA-301 / DSM 14385 / NBRC 107922 / TMO) TaxID=416591 RepID=A8F8J9_PSELT|nr:MULTISPECIES: hypothetical protein [Pseudothermotoga]ABV34483.1 hypothetical protein Tlet_1929 [Pseudothermotoga lettingae TMO]KUK20584.1 MAG: Uncharacterized protein XD56_1495 [Pseudothermotoga lettingae]MDI3494869.1 hypothetical protein [Pseudothermotoga sp.]MDK2883571.1 hypothetical protein [Pseudothermotoga sp.]GLI48570.1 hypothetical protein PLETTINGATMO_07390 [Pseudothermotoga lettingae TMO]